MTISTIDIDAALKTRANGGPAQTKRERATARKLVETAVPPAKAKRVDRDVKKKLAAKAAPKAKAKKAPKYDEALKATVKRAEAIHNAKSGSWNIGPKQVLTVRDALGSREPSDALGMTLARMRKVASGEERIAKADRPAGFATISDGMSDPFCRSRGLAAIAAALAEAR